MICTNCKSELPDGAKFCLNCGHPTTPENNQRKTVYEGEIHKCPNCGAVLNSFAGYCPSCGHELRGAESSSALNEFVAKLEQIDSVAKTDKKRFRSTFGTLYRNQVVVPENVKKKIELIQNYPVPNTREDLLEFIILATSNINYSSETAAQKELNNAWVAKTEQIYNKAKCLDGDEKTFIQIQNIYQTFRHRQKKAKRKEAWPIVFGLGTFLFFASILAIIGIMVSTQDKRDFKKENTRLEQIEQEAQSYLDNGEYRKALTSAACLEFDTEWSGTEEKKYQQIWETKQTYLIDEILEEAEENGVHLEYTPPEEAEDETNENANNSEEIDASTEIDAATENELINGDEENMIVSADEQDFIGEEN